MKTYVFPVWNPSTYFLCGTLREDIFGRNLNKTADRQPPVNFLPSHLGKDFFLKNEIFFQKTILAQFLMFPTVNIFWFSAEKSEKKGGKTFSVNHTIWHAFYKN